MFPYLTYCEIFRMLSGSISRYSWPVLAHEFTSPTKTYNKKISFRTEIEKPTHPQNCIPTNKQRSKEKKPQYSTLTGLHKIKWLHSIFDGIQMIVNFYFAHNHLLIINKNSFNLGGGEYELKKEWLTVFSWICVLQNTQIRCVTVSKRANTNSMPMVNSISNFKHAFLYTRWLFSSVSLVKRRGLQRLYQRCICSSKYKCTVLLFLKSQMIIWNL